MATRQKTTKSTKREMVMPFNDEHNFIVPKRGGFAQSDNENYAMLTASTTLGGTYNTPSDQPIQTGQGLGTSTIESGNTTSTSSPLQTQVPILTTPTTPTNTDTPSLPPLANLPQTTITSDGTTTPPNTTLPSIPTITTTPPRTPPMGDTTITTTPIDTLPTTSTLPTFPSWNTLDCNAIRSEVDRLKSVMMQSRFNDVATLDAYNTQISLGETTYTSKCNTPSTPSTPAIAIIPTPEVGGGGGGGGGFGGGGGGGIGEPPPSDEVTEEAPQSGSKKGLLLILGLIGVLYLLTKKSS